MAQPVVATPQEIPRGLASQDSWGVPECRHRRAAVARSMFQRTERDAMACCCFSRSACRNMASESFANPRATASRLLPGSPRSSHEFARFRFVLASCGWMRYAWLQYAAGRFPHNPFRLGSGERGAHLVRKRFDPRQRLAGRDQAVCAGLVSLDYVLPGHLIQALPECTRDSRRTVSRTVKCPLQ
jgi:hypothetical protein